MHDDVAYICILFKLICMCVKVNVATCVYTCSPVSTHVHQCPHVCTRVHTFHCQFQCVSHVCYAELVANLYHNCSTEVEWLLAAELEEADFDEADFD